MPTAVVSGRVDEDVKRRADVIIRKSGSSVGAVINDVWQTIVETGELPASPSQVQELQSKRATFGAFMKWFDSLPAQNDAFDGMTDDEILSWRVNDYV